MLHLLGADATNTEIADKLVLGVATVRWHTINIYRKIDARGRPDAIAYALRHGLVRT